MKKVSILVILALLLALPLQADVVEIAAPIDSNTEDSSFGWQTMVANAETATTDPFDPFNQSGSTAISLKKGSEGKFTGVILRSKFTAIGRATEPVIACFGRKYSSTTVDWSLLTDANGSTSITIAPTDDSTIENNTNDDTSYWSTPTAKIDALGSDAVVCTVVTAATAGTGVVEIEASRY